MQDWKDILVEMAKKLTPPFAFAVLFVVVLGQFGAQIPAEYTQLVYAVGLALPLLWVGVELAQVVKQSRTAETEKNQQADQFVVGRDSKKSVIIQGTRNEVRYIINNYASIEKPSEKAGLESQLIDYLDWVQESFGSITLRGIEQEGRQVVTLPLETVYVPLQAEASSDGELASDMNLEKMQARLEKEHGTEKIKLNQVISMGKRIIITGGPGSGKTTVLQHIAWTLANAIKAGSPQLAQEKLGLSELPLPIYVPLSLFATYLRDLPKNANGKDKSLATFISDYLLQRQMHLSLSSDFLSALIRDGKNVILLLDGLDEVPDEGERARTRQSIEDLTAGRENLRVLVTSRIAAYRGNAVLGRGFRHIRVLPLHPENVRDLVIQAYSSIYKKSATQASEKSRALLTDIERLENERRERLGDGAEPFVDSPLMVRMLLIVHFNNRRLPDQRADLYQKAVDAMLRPDYNLEQEVSFEIEHRVAGSLAMNREMYQYLAYHMHGQGQEQGREIEEDSLRQILSAEPTYAPFVNELISQTRERGTLLEERGGLYRFIHLSFQEFLVGRYFVEVVRDVEKIAAQIENDLASDSWWREPILLTIGYLDLTAPLMARRLLLRLSGADEGNAARDGKMSLDQSLSAAELAASAYMECKSQALDLAEKLKTRLLILHERGKTEKWSPLIMVAAADTLDELGYSLPGAYSFIPIPNPQSAQFLLARYPVTNAQYARFLKPENFENPALWTGFPMFNQDSARMSGSWDVLTRAWLNEQEKEQGVLFPRTWRDPRFGFSRPNAPLVGISWYEANAYCQWLLAGWDDLEEGRQGLPKPREIRLPTEAEWILAAGGTENDRFAFGELGNLKKLPQYANTDESAIGRTTPVWMYPAGATKEGLMDMSGNVFEWQANYRDEKSGYLALRGGSWYDFVDLARVSGWDYYFPRYGFNRLGFRLVVFALPQ